MDILKNKHIFVVEDNPMNRLIYQVMFVVYETRVTFEPYGQDSLARLKNMSRVDLIVLDLMLPRGVSGFDIFAQIRALPEYNNVPIIAVSAMDPILAIPRAKELGLDGFISKPIDSDIFPEQLAKVLMGEPVWFDGSDD
ncbi:MAG: response regulator [Anaerolineae bacterium]|jgi:CheY-like chemotaxis protein|nr:response regulator [Anaerolineae bacterium]